MDTDPIADNQTELTINKLLNRKDGDPLLNQAVAAMLLSMTKLISEVATIKRDLWKPETLEKMIDQHHQRSCLECPTRKMVQYWEELDKRKKDARAEADGRPWWQYVFSKDGLLVIVILLFALMSIYSIIGKEGYREVTNTVKTHETQSR